MPAQIRQSGFVLAVTLWILAALAVVAALVSSWALDGVRDARTVQEDADAAVAGYGTAQTAIYLLATRDYTRAGLPTRPVDRASYSERRMQDLGALIWDPIGGELWLDDQPYVGLEGTTFSIQDEVGLLGVGWADPILMQKLVSALPNSQGQAPRLRDTLVDYIDEDGQQLPNGAEASAYRAAGRQGPANRRLTSPTEVRMVLGWNKLPASEIERIEALITPFYAGPLNVNTAPRSVLAAWIPGCNTLCDDIIQRRRERPFTNTSELQVRVASKLTGSPETDFRTMPGDEFRITVWNQRGRGMRWHVRRTPTENKAAPWTIMAVYPISSTDSRSDAEPSGSPLFAPPPPGKP